MTNTWRFLATLLHKLQHMGQSGLMRLLAAAGISLALLTACGGGGEGSSMQKVFDVAADRAPIRGATVSEGSIQKVIVTAADGTPIRGATVKVGKVSQSTTGLGLAGFTVEGKEVTTCGACTKTLAAPKGHGIDREKDKNDKDNDDDKKDKDKDKNTILIDVSAPGFVSSQVSVPTKNNGTYRVALKTIGETLQISSIEQAQTFTGSTLGAQITVPANAFVKTTGAGTATTTTLAIGSATLEVTPWDIRTDLAAMPGGGRGIDAAGNNVDLISAGMLTVNFKDASGSHLQLAVGKQANIQMDLPAGTTSINGVTLTVGVNIPLWTFNETRGLWIEEGVGKVIASATSPSGLAVFGTVSHFSTWNWDFKFNGGGTVTVQCVSAAGAIVPCAISADVVLPDGSSFTRSSYADGPVTIINMPASASITWKGLTAIGLQGTAVSGVNTTVNILMSSPTTSVDAICKKPDGTATECKVEAAYNGAPGNPTKTYTLGVSGAIIESVYTGVTGISWKASTIIAVLEGTDLVRYEGTASSAVTGSVTITLGNRVVINPNARTVQVTCSTAPPPFVNPANWITATGATCNVTVNIFDNSNTGIYTSTTTIPVNTSGPIVVPTLPGANFIILSNNACSYSNRSKYLDIDITNNQNIILYFGCIPI